MLIKVPSNISLCLIKMVIDMSVIKFTVIFMAYLWQRLTSVDTLHGVHVEICMFLIIPYN